MPGVTAIRAFALFLVARLQIICGSGGADRAGLLSGDMTRGERFGLLGAPAARAGRSRAREP